MYIEWLHKEKYDFICKTGIYPNKVLTKCDIFEKIMSEEYDSGYIMYNASKELTIHGLKIELCKFAEKEFTFYKV